MDFLRDLLDKAAKLDRETQAKIDAINRNEQLTPKGKAEQIETLDGARRKQIADLQETARQRLRGEKERVQREAKALRAAELTRLRASVGDALLIDGYRTELRHANPMDIRKRIDGACCGWEADVLTLVAVEVLTVRSAGNEDDALTARAALDDFKRARIETDAASRAEALLGELDQWGETWVDSINLAKQRQTQAQWAAETYAQL